MPRVPVETDPQERVPARLAAYQLHSVKNRSCLFATCVSAICASERRVCLRVILVARVGDGGEDADDDDGDHKLNQRDAGNRAFFMRLPGRII